MNTTNGWAKAYRYSADGTLLVQTRIPNIHGPFKKSDAKGKAIRNYKMDKDLPWYPSVLLPHLPNDGEVVLLVSSGLAQNTWTIVGLTGGQYGSGAVDI